MKLDAIRFSIGPWDGRYSSVWRIWSNPGSDDVYLGVRALLNYMKISLHKSGEFRVAYTETHNQKMTEAGKSSEIDRAILKWKKIPVLDNEIMQALDIHFPLSALSLKANPKPPNGKKFCLLCPDETSLGDNDSVTVKVLFHKIHPESKIFLDALKQKNMIPVFWLELQSEEYVTISFHYSKQLPVDISKTQVNRFAVMFREHFLMSGRKIGDIVDDLTIQIFQMNRPPAIHNVGGVSVHWESEKHFSINVGK